MKGKTFSIGLGVFCFLFGLTLFYFQVFAFYSKVSDLDYIKFEGLPIPVSNYRGIDSDTSALKLRGCFNVDPNLFLTKPLAANPTPLAARFGLTALTTSIFLTNLIVVRRVMWQRMNMMA